MKLYPVLFMCIVAVSGCGKGDPGQPGQVVYLDKPGDPPTDEQVLIDGIVSEENDYRLGLGQTAITNGLSCILYTVTGGHNIQNVNPTLSGITQVATFLYADTFNQPDAPITDGLNVLPAPLRSVYQDKFLLRCQGYIVVTKTAYYQFDLRSDDASLLYLDGTKLIDLDGAHGPMTKSGTKYLRKGVHVFRLDYAQTGGGSQSLSLTAGNEFISGLYLYH